MTFYAGIDPGANGAISILSPDGYIQIIDLTTLPLKKLGTVTYFAPPLTLLADFPGCRCLCEAVSGDAGLHGNKSQDKDAGQAYIAGRMFQFGSSAAGIYTLALASGWQMQAALPTQWKPKYGLKGANKQKSIAKAQALYPAIANRITRHDIAEAVLLMDLSKQLKWD
jgi:hypothetical protein